MNVPPLPDDRFHVDANCIFSINERTPGLTVKCPNCDSTSCRESKWRSSREKAAHPGSHPYRCEDCSYRFIAPVHYLPSGRGKLWAGVITLLVAALGGLVIGLSHFQNDRPSRDESASAPTTAVVTQANDMLKAARQGDAEAQYRLGKSMLYDTTRGKEGAAEAVRWLKSAAASGHTGAMVQLGKLYRTGLGVLQNFDLTVEWMSKAAASGDPEGMMELGRLYRSGTGVKQDLIQAYAWFNRAAAALHTEAMVEREDIALRLSPAELKEAQARSAADEAEKGAEISTPAPARKENVTRR